MAMLLTISLLYISLLVVENIQSSDERVIKAILETGECNQTADVHAFPMTANIQLQRIR